ncbi:MAG: FHA domain-containing protein [Clostridiales bacterium]|nr:FHA domain-containing protein [Clostridiales bacterium]
MFDFRKKKLSNSSEEMEPTEIIGMNKIPEQNQENRENQEYQEYDNYEKTVFFDRERVEKVYHPIIRLLDEKNGGKVYEKVVDGCIVIGRKRELCDIVLDYDNTVSSRQCRIYTEDDQLYLTDLGGTNCTYLNNNKVEEDMLLADGDIIGFGRLDLRLTIIDDKES